MFEKGSISKFHTVTSHEVDRYSELRPGILLNIFQDIADEHASLLGVGLNVLRAQGMTWFASKYIIDIIRYPVSGETIKVETWPSAQKNMSCLRDFCVYDSLGEIILTAVSVWVVFDLNSKRPLAPSQVLPGFKVTGRHSMSPDFNRISDPVGNPDLKELDIRFDDIDVNNHVNNAVHLLLALESVPPDMRFGFQPVKFDIHFKGQADYPGSIFSFSGYEGAENGTVSTHILKSGATEISRHRILWKAR